MRMSEILIEKQRVIDKSLDSKTKSEKINIVLPEKSSNKSKIDDISEKITPEQIQDVHEACRELSTLDLDMAQSINGVGWSKVDTRIGHDLASKSELTPRQAALAVIVCRKYHIFLLNKATP